MIGFQISSEIKEELQSLFWKWLNKSTINELYDLIKYDLVLKDFIFPSITTSVIRSDANDDLIKQFFFADFNDPTIIKNLIRDTPSIAPNSISFFCIKYKNVRNSQAAKITRALKLTVCPYCNRNFIDVYNKNGVQKFNGTLDHFYPKSNYPHLSINLYNLIPCCSSCNQSKSTSPLLTFHPYYDEHITSYKFDIKMFTSSDRHDIVTGKPIVDLKNKINDLTYLQGTSDNFKIVIEILSEEYKSKIENSNKLFSLESRYNSSKEFVKELFRKQYVYNDAYADFLCNNYEVFHSREDVKRILFSSDLNETNHNNRPLSKLTLDILKRFGHIM